MSDKAGTYSLTGFLPFIPITAGALSNQNGIGNVVFNVLGQIATFNLSSAVNSTVIVNQFVAILDTFNLDTNGGTVELGAGLTLGETIHATISGGGDYIAVSGGLNFLAGHDTVTFSGTGGTLTIGTPGQYEATTETGTVAGLTSAADVIDDQSLRFAGITGYSVSGTPSGSETVTVNDSSGTFTFKTDNAGLATGAYSSGAGPLSFAADKTGGTTIHNVCFLRGTRIATRHGEIEVETLQPGDMVATRENGATVFQPVTWVGHRSVDVSRMRGEADAHPVRIRAGAFAKNVPHRDLLITPEHCVFVDGRLIPVRMLVNGGSIVSETSISQYEFFHVELHRHSILIADGLETESYLDTGNRARFDNATGAGTEPDLAAGASLDAWTLKAAAPLAVDRGTVEPIWRRLAERAGVSATETAANSSADPELCVVTGTGVTVYPRTRDGQVYSFVVPSDARSIRLVSNASRPSEAIGPFVDDRRSLGVLVGTIGLDTGFGRKTVAAADLADAPRGWHLPEASYRWTDGDAVLPFSLAAVSAPTVTLDIEVIHAGPYPAKRAAARAA